MTAPDPGTNPDPTTLKGILEKPVADLQEVVLGMEKSLAGKITEAVNAALEQRQEVDKGSNEALSKSIEEMAKKVVGEIDNIAEQVRPGAEALVEIRKRIDEEIGTTNAMNTLTTKLEGSTEAVDAHAKKLERLDRSLWFRAVAVIIGLVGAMVLGAWIQHAWLPVWWPPETEEGWKNAIWQNYGEDIRDCILEDREKGRAMRCVIVDPDP